MERRLSAPRAAAVAAASAAAYYVLARVGLELALAGTASCPIWPASGFALAAVIAFGQPAAFGVFLGSTLANLQFLPGAPALSSAAAGAVCAVVALGSAAQALIGARLLGPLLSGRDTLATSRDVLRFGALTPLVCLTAATIGVAALGASGTTAPALTARAWLTWWMGDTVGMILVAPLIFAWRPRDSDEFGTPPSPRRALVSLGALALLCAAFWLGFGEPFRAARYPLSFLPFTALIWISLSLDSRGATAGAAALAALAHWYTTRGLGPFAAAPALNESLLLSSLYVALAALTAFLLRALLAERREASAEVKEAREALERRVQEQDADLWSANATLRVAALGRREDGRRIQLYRQVVSELPVGIAVLRLEDPRDPDSWVIVEMNTAGQRLVNAAEENPAGRRLAEFSPNIRGTEFPRACAEALSLKRGVELDDFTSPDRAPGVRFSVKVFPLGEAVVGIIFEDVTARKAAEAALARSNSELTQFAYVASHDLQAPLRKAAAFADQLKIHLGPGLDDVGRDFMMRLGRSITGMQALIDALLQLARVATDVAPHQPVDLQAIAAEVLSDYEDVRSRTGARLSVSSLPPVLGHPQQLRQLLQNLVDNAMKFRYPDRPAVVRVRGRVLDGGRAELRVEDEGVGFDMKYAARVFLPFQRLHSVKDYPGTGMGLAICQKIVERHGGTISVESAVGQGAVFTVVFPAATSGKPVFNPTMEGALG